MIRMVVGIWWMDMDKEGFDGVCIEVAVGVFVKRVLFCMVRVW